MSHWSGYFFTTTSPRQGCKNTKIEKSVPCRGPFLEILGKKYKTLRKFGNFSPTQGHFFRKPLQNLSKNNPVVSARIVPSGVEFCKLVFGEFSFLTHIFFLTYIGSRAFELLAIHPHLLSKDQSVYDHCRFYDLDIFIFN